MAGRASQPAIQPTQTECKRHVALGTIGSTAPVVNQTVLSPWQRQAESNAGPCEREGGSIGRGSCAFGFVGQQEVIPECSHDVTCGGGVWQWVQAALDSN
jgi:hypothetical protein